MTDDTVYPYCADMSQWSTGERASGLLWCLLNLDESAFVLDDSESPIDEEWTVKVHFNIRFLNERDRTMFLLSDPKTFRQRLLHENILKGPGVSSGSSKA